MRNGFLDELAKKGGITVSEAEQSKAAPLGLAADPKSTN
jgi:hypothetical protein